MRTPSVDEMPAVFESIPTQAGPLGETVEDKVASLGHPFQADLEEQLRSMKSNAA